MGSFKVIVAFQDATYYEDSQHFGLDEALTAAKNVFKKHGWTAMVIIKNPSGREIWNSSRDMDVSP